LQLARNLKVTAGGREMDIFQVFDRFEIQDNCILDKTGESVTDESLPVIPKDDFHLPPQQAAIPQIDDESLLASRQDSRKPYPCAYETRSPRWFAHSDSTS